MKFEIKTVEITANAVETHIFIDGTDVTNCVKKFTLKKDGTPLELSLTLFGNIDVSIDGLEIGDIENIDSAQSEYQYTAKEKKQQEPEGKRMLKRLKETIAHCF